MEGMSFGRERRASTTGERLKPAPTYSQPVTFHYEIQNHTTRMQKLTNAFKVYRLMVMTLVCVVAGIIVGLICRPRASNWTERQFMYIEFPGELYLRFLKLMIIPLLVSNVILSFGTIQGKISSQLGKVASFIYLGNNCMAITVAILMAILINPGGKTTGTGQALLFNSGDTLTMDQHKQANDQSSLHNDMASKHHSFNEYHESINRYRDYHPMFYHTNNNDVEQTDSIRPQGRDGGPVSRGRVGSDDEDEQLLDQEQQQQGQTNWLGGLLFRRAESSIKLEEQNRMSGTKNTDHDNRHRVKLFGISSDDDTTGFTPLQRRSNRINLATKLPIDVVLDVFRNLIPDSLIGSALQQTRTRLFAPKELKINKNGSTDPTPNHWPMGHEMINQPNVIGLLAASVMAGVVLSHMEAASSKPLLELCSCISELSLRVGMKAIDLAPPCIMFLLIGQIARARNLSSMAGELFMYSFTVVLALVLHGFVLLPLFYYLITKKSPLKFFKGMIEALVASFATSSSSATMALSLNCLSELNLNMIIVRAFGPLGCVFNMNGTAIYEAVGVIFIAQTLDVPLPTTSILLIGLCSAVASLSTAGIPSSGMMNMVIVLNAINLPVLQLSLIYIVDFIIDRFRTVINVWSGAVVCGLIDHLCPEHLFEEEMKPEKYREMMKYRGSRGSLSNRKSLVVEEKPQVISVTITPPPPPSSPNENNNVSIAFI